MKKHFAFFLIALIAATNAYAGDPISVFKIFDSEEIAAGASSTGNGNTTEINLNDYNVVGYFSLYYVITGSGTCKFEYLVRPHTDETAIEPASASDIDAGATAGTYTAEFNPVPTKYISIKATETGGADTVTVTAYLTVQ